MPQPQRNPYPQPGLDPNDLAAWTVLIALVYGILGAGLALLS